VNTGEFTQIRMQICRFSDAFSLLFAAFCCVLLRFAVLMGINP
jgi:hypothetical protein